MAADSPSRLLPFEIIDVFATERPFSGNPLAVFTDAQSLSELEMAALARQMNLSETTFILPAELPGTDAFVRIFTPSYEMPFAGHPTLGTARVLSERLGLDKVTLGMKAGAIPVERAGDRYTLAVHLVSVRALDIPAGDVARAVGLDESDIAGPVQRIDTGTEQVILPVHSPERVARASVDVQRFLALPKGKQPTKILLWAKSGPQAVLCRFFFPVYSAGGGTVAEDPGTGSAAANLGGWLLTHGEGGSKQRAIEWTLSQGESTGRPCRLGLALSGDQIRVSGHTVRRGAGNIFL